MDINIVVLIGVIGTICSIVFGYVGYKRGLRKEAYEDGTLKADTQYIKRRVDDMLLEQRDINKNMNLITERVTRVEESTKQAHKRIDNLIQ